MTKTLVVVNPAAGRGRSARIWRELVSGRATARGCARRRDLPARDREQGAQPAAGGRLRARARDRRGWKRAPRGEPGPRAGHGGAGRPGSRPHRHGLRPGARALAAPRAARRAATGAGSDATQDRRPGAYDRRRTSALRLERRVRWDLGAGGPRPGARPPSRSDSVSTRRPAGASQLPACDLLRDRRWKPLVRGRHPGAGRRQRALVRARNAHCARRPTGRRRGRRRCDPPRAALAGALASAPDLQRGTHLGSRYSRAIRARSVRIEPRGPVPPFDLDGEVFEFAPSNLVLIPGALRVLA